MEQDIKRLKEKINNIKKYDTYRYDWTETDVQTVEHLIKAYKELEEKNKKKSIEIICYQEELENSIPVSLVEEKIEELSEDLEIMKVDAMYGRYKEYDSKLSFEKQFSYKYGMHDVLQELLEKRK